MIDDALKTGWFDLEEDPLIGGWFESLVLDFCYNIYGGKDGDIDYDTPLASNVIESATTAEITIDLPADTIWHFTRTRAAIDCDLESDPSEPLILQIAGDGSLLPQSPEAPIGLTAEIYAGGKIKLRWRYEPEGDMITPTAFNIFVNDGTGFDFTDPYDVIDYRPAGSYSWLSPALTDGVRYRFAVRSYSSVTGGSSSNTASVAAIADSSGPAAISGLIAEVIEV